jgi:hypothetical protein
MISFEAKLKDPMYNLDQKHRQKGHNAGAEHHQVHSPPMSLVVEAYFETFQLQKLKF